MIEAEAQGFKAKRLKRFSVVQAQGGSGSTAYVQLKMEIHLSNDAIEVQ